MIFFWVGLSMNEGKSYFIIHSLNKTICKQHQASLQATLFKYISNQSPVCVCPAPAELSTERLAATISRPLCQASLQATALRK